MTNTGQPKTLDPITLFHNPTVSASNRALQILKSASASASEASSNSARGEFQLDVTTLPPTTEQLRSILDYLGAGPTPRTPGEVVPGASDVKDALRKYTGMSEQERGGGFARPVVSSFSSLAVGLGVLTNVL